MFDTINKWNIMATVALTSHFVTRPRESYSPFRGFSWTWFSPPGLSKPRDPVPRGIRARVGLGELTDKSFFVYMALYLTIGTRCRLIIVIDEQWSPPCIILRFMLDGTFKSLTFTPKVFNKIETIRLSSSAIFLNSSRLPRNVYLRP